MKLNLNIPLLDMDGQPALDRDNKATVLKTLVRQALWNMGTGDDSKSMECADLCLKMAPDGDQDYSAEELVLMKGSVKAWFKSPGTIRQIINAIDAKDEQPKTAGKK